MKIHFSALPQLTLLHEEAPHSRGAHKLSVEQLIYSLKSEAIWDYKNYFTKYLFGIPVKCS